MDYPTGKQLATKIRTAKDVIEFFDSLEEISVLLDKGEAEAKATNKPYQRAKKVPQILQYTIATLCSKKWNIHGKEVSRVLKIGDSAVSHWVRQSEGGEQAPTPVEPTQIRLAPVEKKPPLDTSDPLFVSLQVYLKNRAAHGEGSGIDHSVYFWFMLDQLIEKYGQPTSTCAALGLKSSPGTVAKERVAEWKNDFKPQTIVVSGLGNPMYIDIKPTLDSVLSVFATLGKLQLAHKASFSFLNATSYQALTTARSAKLSAPAN